MSAPGWRARLRPRLPEDPRERHWALIVLVALAVVGVALAVRLALLAPSVTVSPAERAALEAEIEELRRELAARVAADPWLASVEERTGNVVVGIRSGLVQDIARWATHTYLDDVRLHLNPDVVVEERQDVRTKVGPISVGAGHWELRVTITRVDAVLGAESIELTPRDSSRVEARIAVRVAEASGDADIRFTWDASTAGSVVCGDFEFDESLSGVVDPFTYEIVGAFALESAERGILAVPEFGRPRLRVRPKPTPESWARVEEFLDHQNNIFRCGIALKPDELREKLATLLDEGFEFELPESIFRPITLPARISDRIAIEGEGFAIESVPADLHVVPDAVWYGATLEVVRVGPPETRVARAGG
ncbi:MAG: hypothetical protein R3195_03870 [Gemmatimonadota bacterium]|nr:hypothetical protein [Gemmatimonadota bacterium]